MANGSFLKKRKKNWRAWKPVEDEITKAKVWSIIRLEAKR